MQGKVRRTTHIKCEQQYTGPTTFSIMLDCFETFLHVHHVIKPWKHVKVAPIFRPESVI